MKIFKTMMIVAAAAMVFAACGKEDKDAPSQSDKTNDMMIYDGEEYSFTKTTGFGQDGFYAVTAEQQGEVPEGGEPFHIELKIHKDYVNQTYDLANPIFNRLSIDVIWPAAVRFSYEVFEEHVYTILDGEIHEDAYAVSSGTFSTSLTEETLTMEFDLTLANGHHMAMRTVTDVADIRYLPFCGSSL